jgi:hypothetical protein
VGLATLKPPTNFYPYCLRMETPSVFC